MPRFRSDVRLVPRDTGGAFLIDLSGDSFALPGQDAAFAMAFVHGAESDIANPVLVVPQDFIDELAQLRLFEAPESLCTRLASMTNRVRMCGIRLLLRVTAATSRSSECLTRRLLTVAYLVLKFCSWPVVATAWTGFFAGRSPAPKILEIANPDEAGEIVHQAAARHFLPVRCKERSLALFALCHLSGFPSRIHAGCCPTIFQLHCWLESDNRIVGDDAAFCAEFNTIETWS